jgi:hypothetical protein
MEGVQKMNKTDFEVFVSLLPQIIGTVSTIVSWKIFEAITSRVEKDENKKALKQAVTVCLIVGMFGATLGGLWRGYLGIRPDPTKVESLAKTPTQPKANPPGLPQTPRNPQGRGRGDRGKGRTNKPPVEPPAAPATQLASAPKAAKTAQSQSPPASTETAAPPPAPAASPQPKNPPAGAERKYEEEDIPA